MRTSFRDPNLDLLRAAAITLVTVYHVNSMWPCGLRIIDEFCGLGRFGVTLFFVLSGWLIGGIYWREQKASGRVGWGRFWARRWLRTVPPYILGMMLGYAAVLLDRKEPFDSRYLVFAQNYAWKMPFYTISWSLCVEEHFYLALPFIGAAAARMPQKIAAATLWSLPLLPTLLRCLDPLANPVAPFGYSHTATHLVTEGLGLGVAAAFTAQYFPRLWTAIQCICRKLLFPSLLVFLSVAFWNANSVFFIGQSVVAWTCFVWLGALAGQAAPWVATHPLVYAIAVSSYSIYLTHSLAIHAARRLTAYLPGLPTSLTGPACAVVLISLSGGAFYFLAERTSIQFRDFLSRKPNRQPPSATKSFS